MDGKNRGKLNEPMEFDSDAKERCINRAVELSRKSIKRDKSFLDVLRTQLGMISGLSWGVHLMIIFCISLALQYGIGLPKSGLVNLLLVLLGPILQLAAIPEVMVSYRYKVWQMEQCAVIPLAQLILVRIAIWQTVNFLYIAGLMLVLRDLIGVAELAVYILIPYNLSNAAAFRVLGSVKKHMAGVVCFVVSLMLVLVYYGGIEGNLFPVFNDVMRTFVGHLPVFWGASIAAFVFSAAGLYKNALYGKFTQKGKGIWI